ncbi:hypothetical protein DL240_01015 [Lujinxingia litoralis]|uniref:Diguanylate cyclase n=1 Tax=Lujinxingia litoralis TaxID=2211119 RepID=A0A328C9N5_9DELT|nr:diguanylate cyclase [Lujinxingia litoralis]RAL24822.1 hypothetical protein DL240_01015 [Lujinxingia litoralis]
MLRQVLIVLKDEERATRLQDALGDLHTCALLRAPSPPDALEHDLRSVQALVIDADALEQGHAEVLARWRLTEPPPLVLTLGESPSADLWLPPGTPDAELALTIQRHLHASPSPYGSLSEESVVVLEEGARRQDFIATLDIETAYLRHLLEELMAGRLPARSLRQAIAPMEDAARHFELTPVSDALAALSKPLRTLHTASEPASRPDILHRLPTLFARVRQRVREAQLATPPSALNSAGEGRALTVVVIDSDEAYLKRVERFAEQFMIPLRSATTVDEACYKVQTPLLAGVLLTLQPSMSRARQAEDIRRLQEASELKHLPLALACPEETSLDRVHGLWAGASQIVAKPVSAVSFSQIAQRLAISRRAHQSCALILDPEGDFASEVARHLGEQDVAVHYRPDASSIFDELERHRPDLLLMNAELPGISPFDLCRSLRAVPRWQDLPIVLFSSTASSSARLAAYEAGADDFILSNLSRNELLARLNVRMTRARQARERADRDVLTGLLTRRAFLEQLAARMAEVTRHHRRLVFAILDVDHFKRVNDHHGHPAGDRVLATLGRLLQDRFRIEDLRARWGGEEFVVVLVDEAIDTSARALQRVHDELCAMQFEGESGRAFSVSFSAGLAAYPDDGGDAEALLSVADARLLRAKRAGRRRIEIGRGPPQSP